MCRLDALETIFAQVLSFAVNLSPLYSETLAMFNLSFFILVFMLSFQLVEM